MAFHVENYEIRWKNYRPFEDTDWITIKPLTILLGANNSGKTSIIAPLLLMAQTMSSRDAITPLVTRGPLIDVGTFKQVIHNHDDSKPLFLGLRYHLHSPQGKLKRVGAYPPGAAELMLIAGEGPGEILLQQFDLFDIYKRPLLRQGRKKDGTYTIKFGDELTPQEKEAVQQSRPVNFLFSPAAAIRRYEKSESHTEETPTESPSRAFNRYLSTIAFAFEELRQVLRTMTYVGPLRDRPHRYYEIASETPFSVGSRGQHMANLIRRRFKDGDQQLDNWVARFEFGLRFAA